MSCQFLEKNLEISSISFRKIWQSPQKLTKKSSNLLNFCSKIIVATLIKLCRVVDKNERKH